MMMNGSMQGGVNGSGAGQMPPMQGQMGMSAMGMGRMPMGPDQVQTASIQLHKHYCIKTRRHMLPLLICACIMCFTEVLLRRRAISVKAGV